MVSGLELDRPDALADPPALHLRRGRQVLGADDVGGGTLAPADSAGDWANGTADCRVSRDSAPSVVSSSQSWRKNSRIRSGWTPIVPSSPGSSQGAGSPPVSSAWD